MILSLYEPFRHWSERGAVYILSDLHFKDKDCKLIATDWPEPEEQLAIINNLVSSADTFVCLGDVGNLKYVELIRAGRKVLITGNHDAKGACRAYFDEIYTGPLFITDKILLSHEPVHGLEFCLNIHGHDHGNKESYHDNCHYLNLASNVCGYTPINLGKIIQEGVLAGIKHIHKCTIDARKIEKRRSEDEAIL